MQPGEEVGRGVVGRGRVAAGRGNGNSFGTRRPTQKGKGKMEGTPSMRAEETTLRKSFPCATLDVFILMEKGNALVTCLSTTTFRFGYSY